MKFVEWTIDAKRDFAGIDDFHAEQAPDYAARVGFQALAAGRFLAERPYAGPEIMEDGTRKWPVPGTRYRLFYRVLSDRVQILRVRHEREDWVRP